MKNPYRKAGKALLILSASGLTGCAGFGPTAAPVVVPQGLLFQQTKAPLTYKTPFKIGSKVGQSSVSYLGYPMSPILSLSIGDGSIKSAAESAGITTIEHVDYEKMNILNVFTRIKVFVYGD